MTRLRHLSASLQQSLTDSCLLKVIAGLNNFDASSVHRVALAADSGGADLLDIACDPALISVARKSCNLPICVSAVDPYLFPAAISAGADMIEIGNFDSFYPEGRIFDAEEVLSLSRATRNLLPETVLSVTVPHVLPLDQQAQLALDLAATDVDLIQTEGGTSSRPLTSGAQGLIEKATPALAAAYEISKAISLSGFSIPILCSSGLSDVTAPMAIAAGASGVGIGSAVNRLEDEVAMVAVVKRVREALVNKSRIPIK